MEWLMNEYAIFIRGNEQEVLDTLTEIEVATENQDLIAQCESIREIIRERNPGNEEAWKKSLRNQDHGLDETGSDENTGED
jgi:hypothetical protein